MSRNSSVIGTIGLVAAAALVIISQYVWIAVTSDTYAGYQVTEKESIAKGSEGMMVYVKKGEDYREFENDNNYLLLKFDSRNLQNRLEVGKCFNVTAYGWRVGFLGMYENIRKIEPVDCK